jgi:methionyl-tRNA formyltransferase
MQSLSRDHVDISTEVLHPESLAEKKYDFAISFGYRHILGRECIEVLQGNILNIHISLLPWNKGSDPNIWSWLENTPKGVSIHWVTESFDSGDIALQKSVSLNPEDDLISTYEDLITEAAFLFHLLWNDIGILNAQREKQNGAGSTHRRGDLKIHEKALTSGLQTKCKDLMEYGRSNNLWVNFD